MYSASENFDFADMSGTIQEYCDQLISTAVRSGYPTRSKKQRLKIKSTIYHLLYRADFENNNSDSLSEYTFVCDSYDAPVFRTYCVEMNEDYDEQIEIVKELRAMSGIKDRQNFSQLGALANQVKRDLLAL